MASRQLLSSTSEQKVMQHIFSKENGESNSFFDAPLVHFDVISHHFEDPKVCFRSWMENVPLKNRLQNKRCPNKSEKSKEVFGEMHIFQKYT